MIGFIIGFFIGGFFGVMIAALAAANRDQEICMNNGDKIVLNGEVTRCMTALNSGAKYRVKIGDQEIWFSEKELQDAMNKKED